MAKKETRGTAVPVHVALLRGVNVGGKHALPMKTLAEMFRDAGCGAVRTYIQSGNVLFEAKPALALRIPGLIERAIAHRFGFEAPVVLRSAAQLRDVARGNPFLKAGADPKTLHVGFLRDRPAPPDIASLDPDRSPPDRFTLVGSEVYLHCPNGVARSKLTSQYFDSRLKTILTARNWNTVVTLLDLAQGADGLAPKSLDER